jgi:hypothetical protein
MTLDDLWAQLESDLKWRQDELRLLSNSIASIGRASDQDRARRAQFVMLYAHTEGFSKVALSTYVRAINDLQLAVKTVSEYVVASAFADVFHAVRHGDPKGKVFKLPLPEDEGLKVFCRQCEFISDIEALLSRPVNVPDSAVDTESNLNSKVLRRNLYRLGFPANKFEAYESDLDELVYRRHSIAHGIDFDPVRRDLYLRLEKNAFGFMDDLSLSIIDATEQSAFLKKTVPATA